jgi:carboxypeptidase Taq
LININPGKPLMEFGMQQKLDQLSSLIREARDIFSAINLLSWDQATYMPGGGAEARGRQLAVLTKIYQEKITNPAIGHLLDSLSSDVENLPYDSDAAAMVRATRREFERAIKVPPDFAAEFAEHQANSYQVWTIARPANDWQRVKPYLEKTLEYSRRQANFYPGYQHIADPLIDLADYGMKAADVKRIFTDLRTGLVPIIRSISNQAPADDSCLKAHFPKESQLKFSEEVSRKFGYDFHRGRLDLTHHPFEITLAVGDVRITTRVKEDDLGECMFGVFHESGHAMYEQGCNPAYDSSILQGGVSAGVHESQSRTWENIVGRSRAFWEYYYPNLQHVFPDQLGKVSLDTFYRAINKVQPSLIRTDADEVTYNLHPLIRFELELELLEGSLSIDDLPQEWNKRYVEYLGVEPVDYSSGVMQDVHWFSVAGFIGGSFQGYTLGNILSAMFYEKALAAHPEITDEIRRGEFSTLHSWLKQNIYQYGSKYPAPELIQRVTGSQLDVQPLLRYIKTKYGELYQL